MKIPGKGLLSRIFRNCADPKGALGRLMLRLMNFGPVYDWTFDHCPLADGMRALDVSCGGGGAILELSRSFTWRTRHMTLRTPSRPYTSGQTFASARVE